MNDILLQVLSDDKNLIVYRKELNRLTGSVTATILLQQLIFHASQKKYSPFYKFVEPCTNEFYRSGDSWTEELGFTKYEFNTAYKKIENLGIVTKKINMNRVTFYTLNKSILGKLIMSIYEKSVTIQKEPSNNGQKGVSFVSEDYQLTKSENINLDNSKNKEQRIQEEDEEEINLNFMDEYINEITNNKKNIKGSYIAYKASVIDALTNPHNKRHNKTLRNYREFVKEKNQQISKPALTQLKNIENININNYKNKKIKAKYDDGVINYIEQIAIDCYEVNYKGLAVRQSHELVHTEKMSSQELIKLTRT